VEESSGYDADGNVVSFNDSVMGSWTYGYDNLNRVTSGVASSGPYPGYSDCFAYDAWGNRTGEAFSTTGCGSSPTPTTWANYSASNRITSTGLMPAGYSYDAAGNVTNDGVNQYLYDNEERVCAVYDPTSGAMTGYIYDANGDRIAKGTLTSFNCTSSNGFSLNTSYILDKDGYEVSVFNGSTWDYSNIYAAGKLLATYTNAPSEVDFPLTDWLGTKRMTVHPLGSVATCWSSVAYGNSLAPCGGNGLDPSNLRFTGKERDAESGNDYFGARYYPRSMGRWMSPDYNNTGDDPQPIPYADLEGPQSLIPILAAQAQQMQAAMATRRVNSGHYNLLFKQLR
jgi:RHS repeat-associated protein